MNSHSKKDKMKKCSNMRTYDAWFIEKFDDGSKKYCGTYVFLSSLELGDAFSLLLQKWDDAYDSFVSRVVCLHA